RRRGQRPQRRTDVRVRGLRRPRGRHRHGRRPDPRAVAGVHGRPDHPMTARSRKAVAVGIGLLALAPSAATAAGPTQQGPIPEEYTEPTPAMVADSILIWDPSDSVHVWDVSGHVTGMETLTTEGEESVLSLDSDILFAFGSAELPASAASTIADLVGDIPQ